MTNIIPPQPSQDLPQLISTAVQAVLSNPQRLGLTWRLLLGTVATVQDANNLSVSVDGDPVSIAAKSLIGMLAQEQRVYVIQVPPGGNFVIGYVTNLEGLNGLLPVRLVGWLVGSGAPTAGSWNAGDLVIDSSGVWHLCTVAGTPGTWT